MLGQKFSKLPFVAVRRHDDTKLVSGQLHASAALLQWNSHPRHPLHTTLSCPRNRLDAVTYTDVTSLAGVQLWSTRRMLATLNRSYWETFWYPIKV